jgi:hypothetical protein
VNYFLPGIHADDGADAIATGFCADEFDAQTLSGAASVEND